MQDSFKARRKLEAGGRRSEYFALDAIGEPSVGRLPYSLKILLENLLRLEVGRSVTREDILTLARADPGKLRILNIHPALLPAFPGLDAQRQALEHGAKVAACTVHFVDEELDHGPIVLQAVVPVLEDDSVETLSARILAEEHRIYPEAVAHFAAGGLRVEGRRVRILAPSSV